MTRIEELSKVSLKQVYDTVKELNITLKYIEKCIGAYQGYFSMLKMNGHPIDDKYNKRIINTLYALKMLREGYTLQPIKSGEKLDPEGDIEEALEVIKDNCKHIQNRIIRRQTQSLIIEVQDTLNGDSPNR